MNRRELQDLSRQRRKEAHALLQRHLYPGAYYLIGYSVECALKACIAKQTERYEFPNKDLANRAYTHNVQQLVNLSGLDPKLQGEMKANSKLETNWLIVKDWTEASRYETGITKARATDMYSACVARKHGFLSWIARQW